MTHEVFVSDVASAMLVSTRPLGELQELTSFIENSARQIPSRSSWLGDSTPSGHAHTRTNPSADWMGMNLASQFVTKPLLLSTLSACLLLRVALVLAIYRKVIKNLKTN